MHPRSFSESAYFLAIFHSVRSVNPPPGRASLAITSSGDLAWRAMVSSISGVASIVPCHRHLSPLMFCLSPLLCLHPSSPSLFCLCSPRRYAAKMIEFRCVAQVAQPKLTRRTLPPPIAQHNF